MDPLAIIEQLDITEDRCSGTFPAQEVRMMNELVLEVREEALSHCVIVSRTFRPHAGQYPNTCHSIQIPITAIDATLVGVVNQSRLRCAMFNRHVQCAQC